MTKQTRKLVINAMSMVGLLILLVSGIIRQAELVVTAFDIARVDMTGRNLLEFVVRVVSVLLGLFACIQLFADTSKKE